MQNRTNQTNTKQDFDNVTKFATPMETTGANLINFGGRISEMIRPGMQKPRSLDLPSPGNNDSRKCKKPF